MEFQNKTIGILMVCHGNICRSPMAEFVLKDLIEKRHLSQQFYVASAATSSEEIGNPVHPGTRKRLKEAGISSEGKYAVQLSKNDYDKYDYFIGMEQRNITNMMRILGGDPKGKVRRLLDFGANPRDIADPWYTGDFDKTYNDILEGCEALLNHILKQIGEN
ncbi:low molecular weight protein-tyrosine-phosphatase [Lacrimispora sp. JR3]|uniref:low molecular weight protein-tyrosine-phosphatase n=1 Tax=Lacrimispora sinapis TaxID=3111456 RepID=UPI0037487A6A